jgi:hypothetical protein
MVIVLLATGLAWASPAMADDFTVGTASDTSATPCPSPTATCSLRQLILYVNAHPFPPDTITVPPGTYTLALGALVINQSVTVVGAGANSTVIQEPVPADRSSMGDRVFDIAAVSGGLTPTVSISGIEVAGGDANPSNQYFGGDIRNAGVLTLSDDWITNGFACSGGGVGNAEGSLTILDSLVSGNHSACLGGDSGGVENFGQPGTPDLPGHLVINDSTIADNDARLVGGVFSWNDPNNTMTIENSTIAGNASEDESGGAARGGGGGLGLGDGIARIRNTILAGNVEITGGVTTPTNCAPGPGLTSLGLNIDSGTDCGLSDTTAGQADQSNTNPLLGSLENNGGPTMTLALGAGSPALDRVPDNGAACPATDQRGVPRPQGSACDIGAFELQVPPHCSNVSGKTAPGGSAITVAMKCTANAPGALTYAVGSQHPKHGSLSGFSPATGVVKYTPKKGFSGTDKFTFNASNSGGTSLSATVTVTVPKPPPPRLNPSMTWTFGLSRSYITVRAMDVTSIAEGAKITIACSGKGCKENSHTVVPPTPKPHCKKGKKCPKPKPATHVSLASVFKGWHFGSNAALTVRIVKSGDIGKVYIFTFHPPHPPATRVTCVAPGSKTPGKNC